MIKLKDQALSTTAKRHLARYQNRIISKPDYAAQVAEARRLWKPNHVVFDEVTRVLTWMSPGTRRCCYCEDARADDIEHFRPKHLYPHLTFEWANYLFACSACNSNAKREQFAVFDAAGTIQDVTRVKGQPVVPPLPGDPVLINPRYEDPMKYLRLEFRAFHFVPQKSLSAYDMERARYTIDTLQLNLRAELPHWRRTACRIFIGWIDTYHRYQKADDRVNMQRHVQELKNYNHLAVWEEMRRIYKERDSRWNALITKVPALAEINAAFRQVPDVLSITIL